MILIMCLQDVGFIENSGGDEPPVDMDPLRGAASDNYHSPSAGIQSDTLYGGLFDNVLFRQENNAH